MNAEFALLKQILKEQNQEVKPKVNKNTCKACGITGKMKEIYKDGVTVCSNCGVVADIIFEDQDGFEGDVGNGKAVLGKVIIEDDVQIKYFVKNFMFVLFSGEKEGEAEARSVAIFVRNLRMIRSKQQSLNKGYLRGYKMSEVAIAILHCIFIHEKRAMPLGILTFMMNNHLNTSLKDYSVAKVTQIEKIKRDRKFGFAEVLAKLEYSCTAILPSEFITFPMNTILNIKNKKIHSITKTLSNALFKEFPNMSISEAVVASGCLFYVGNLFGPFMPDIFGLTTKQSSDFIKKIESSSNPVVKTSIDELLSYV